MLADGARLHYCNLVPNPSQRPHSSLGYMMGCVAQAFGDGAAGWYVDEDRLDVDRFIADLRAASAGDWGVCIATTAFALVAVLDELEARGIRLRLQRGSRIMETGGFKGRTRTIDRAELYRRAAGAFGIPESAIVAEYGMTELTSQYYDRTPALADGQVRYKRSGPWLRPRVVGPDGAMLPDGVVGSLVHVDLANRSSCVAIATEDLGARVVDPETGTAALVLIGRERGAELRGCSLDAETLRDVRA
jgi:Acyl-protein synthetase, LuxE